MIEQGRTHDRRTVLKMAGAGGAMIATITFMAGCGGGESDASGEAAEPDAQVQTAVQQAIRDGIEVGDAAFLETERVVVTHPAAAEYKVFADVCPHQNGRVTMVDEATGRLVCVLHGSQFDPVTGDVVVGPSARGLTPVDVDVQAPAPTAN